MVIEGAFELNRREKAMNKQESNWNAVIAKQNKVKGIGYFAGSTKGGEREGRRYRHGRDPVGRWANLTEKLLRLQSEGQGKPRHNAHLIACINFARMARKLLLRAQRSEEEHKEEQDQYMR